MIDDDRKVLDEIRQRAIRFETRLMTFANKMGIDLKEELYDVDVVNKTVTLPALDGSISAVVRACHRYELKHQSVRVLFEGRCIGELYV
jgi:tRNA A-37 threonylcarbamoyl transferase component Bud32